MTIEIDINDRTPRTPCQTEGCGHPNYHVCLFGKEDKFPELIAAMYTKSPNARFGARSQAHKDAISRSQQARWAAHYAANAERDNKLIERYSKGDIGMKTLAEEFEMGYGTVRSVLVRAAKNGLITLNPKGVMPPNHQKIA